MSVIVAIRPEPGLQATLALGREQGLDIYGEPLFEAVPLDWGMPDMSACDALLVGSGNVFRHGGAKLEQLRHLPVHAVGKATADAAHAAGFTVANIGSGGLQGLLDALDQPMRFLRLAGAERVVLQEPPHVSIISATVYDVVSRPFSETLTQTLSDGALALLHSAAAAKHFAAECDRLQLDRSAISLACLGPRIAEAAGKGWAQLASAPQPNDAALLALAKDMVY